jgi:hypothetical protein
MYNSEAQRRSQMLKSFTYSYSALMNSSIVAWSLTLTGGRLIMSFVISTFFSKGIFYTL